MASNFSSKIIIIMRLKDEINEKLGKYAETDVCILV